MNNQQQPTYIKRFAWGVIGGLFLVLGTLTLAFDAIFPSGNTFQLAVGDIAPTDIFAPENRTYISTVRTEERRAEARAQTAPIYVDIPDVGPQQLAKASDIIEYINLIRNNPYATPNHKLADLQAITTRTPIAEATWVSVRDASAARWSRVADQIILVLERTLRRDIPADQVDDEARLLPTRVEASFSDADKAIIIEITSQLIVPTIEFDAEATRDAQDVAAAAVVAEEISYRQGSLIIAKGQEIRPVDMEALGEFGLLQKTEDAFRIVIGSLVLLVVASIVMTVYLVKFYPTTVSGYTMFGLVAFLFLEFLAGARLFADGFEQFNLFPGAALALLLVTLIGPHFATVTTAALAILVGYMIRDDANAFAIQIAVGGFVGVLAMRRYERQTSYFFAGLVIGLANAATVIGTGLVGTEAPDGVALAGDAFIALTSGLFAAGVALVQLGVISSLLNLPTSLRLIDLMRPDQPLLQRLLREAPGTFQHSLQVANLGELAAERIGADATLVRVAAMYHDVGKMLNPHFFVENQKGVNPHDFIDDPKRSASILISHVTEGERMARRYRLPRRLRDFVREHHGTTRPYFYYKALELAGGDTTQVNAAEYTYPGPTPQTKETAILMLADSIESAARSIRPSNEEEVARVVNMIFEKVLQEGQLDESHMTLNDLKVIREVFVDTLQGIYHTRIKYPGQEGAQLQATSQAQLPVSPPAPVEETPPAEAPSTEGQPAPEPEAPQATAEDDDKSNHVEPPAAVTTEQGQDELLAEQAEPEETEEPDNATN